MNEVKIGNVRRSIVLASYKILLSWQLELKKKRAEIFELDNNISNI